MTPPLLSGVLASQIQGHLSSFESIATVTVGAGGASSVSFSSIPQTYKHLQIRCLALSSTAGQVMQMQFNGDTGTNYARHYLAGDGASATAAASTTTNLIRVFGTVTGSNTTYPVGVLVDILDYTNTNKNKTSRALGGGDYNGSGDIALLSGVWLSTVAISSVLIFPSGGNFAQYSSFALYGLKG